MILLIVAAALSSTKRPGWQWLAVVTGLTYVFLGIIALLVPDYPGSWGQLGGLASLFAGAMYIMLTLVVAEGMRLREESRRIALSFK